VTQPVPSRQTAAWLVLALDVVATAWSPLLVRWAHMPAIAVGFYRVLFAAALLWALLAAAGRLPRRLTRRQLLLASLGGAFLSLDIAFFYFAVLHAPVGGVTFLGNSGPVWVGLFTWAITRRLPSARFWTGLAIALAGMALIVSGDLQRLRYAFDIGALSSLFAIFAAICFAMYLLVTSHLRGQLDSLPLLALSTTSGALVLLLVALCLRVPLVIPGATSLSAVLVIAVVCQVGGYFCLTYALGHLPAPPASVVLLAVAPLTALLAYFVFGDRMTPIQLLGGSLILLAVYTVTRPSPKSAPSTP
jgi:drug/metabolite transporter (DMT)-like permease